MSSDKKTELQALKIVALAFINMADTYAAELKSLNVQLDTAKTDAEIAYIGVKVAVVMVKVEQLKIDMNANSKEIDLLVA